MSDGAPDLSVVIVSFNTRELLRACLRSLAAGGGGRSYEAIVVDNASSDGSAQMVRAEFPEAVLIESGGNPGFAAATNRGCERARGRVIVWLNSDCEVAPGSLAALADHLAVSAATGACGPLLVYPDGRPQPSAQAFPTASRVLWHFLGIRRLASTAGARAVLRRLPGLGAMSRSYLDSLEPAAAPRAVDWLSGACIAFPRPVMERVGLLDERYFMYCEDADWCHRVHDAGLEVHFVPAARVTHHVGASRGVNPVATYHYYRSLYLYLQRYRPGSMALVRACLAAGSLANGLARAIAGLFAPRPAINPWWAVLRLSLSGDAGAARSPGA
jgi:GT2 family glycosyltransferase